MTVLKSSKTYKMMWCRYASRWARDANAHHQIAAELSTRLAERGARITSAVCHVAATRKTSAHSVHAEKLAAEIRLAIVR